MKQNKVWLITGASSGIGLEIAKSALASGHKVVATGRDTEKVSKSIGAASNNLLVVKMDVTDSKEIEMTVKSAVDKFPLRSKLNKLNAQSHQIRSITRFQSQRAFMVLLLNASVE